MNIDWIIFFAGALNLLIGWVVWKSNSKNKLNIFFGIFCLMTSLQIFFDFIFRFFPTLFILRCSYAFATLIPLTASLWIFEICNIHIKKWLKSLYFLPGIVFFVITFIDGLIVKEIKGLSILGYEGVLGPLFTAYTFYFAIYVTFFVILLYRAQKKSDFIKKTQLNYVLCGILLYSGFAMVFSLILPAFFNVYDLTLLDAPSFIFFAGFAGYAITKHHLFDVKVIATELFTFAIWIILLIKTLLSKNLQDLLVNGSLLLAMVVFGVLLIRSILNEVKQREKIEKMAEEVKKAYEVEKEAYEVEKKAREELQFLDKAKNQFLLTTQHHLRTPLTSMMGYVDLLLSGAYGKQSKKTRDVIQRFQVSTSSLIKMVNEFLDITQFQLGKEVVSLKPDTRVDLIIKEIVKELEFETKKKGIYLKFEKPKEEYLIKADPQKLKAALFNIFDNAIKYTQKGGVTIKMENHAEQDTGLPKNVKIIVQDTGIGISQEVLKNLFNRTFERGEQAKKEFVTGRGIGLYIASQIIKAHNGKLWAESKGEGKGSTFYIELPIEE